MNRNDNPSASVASRQAPPVVLSIAGSDNSAGAGIQADLKTFGALGTYGLTAITCVVAEVPGKVSAIQAIDPQIVKEQIRLSFEAYPVAAVKTGMLYSKAILEAVCDELEVQVSKTKPDSPLAKAEANVLGAQISPSSFILHPLSLPYLVVDPVMVATSGASLLGEAALEVYTQRLFKLAALVTPNLDEVATLLGRKVTDLSAMREAGQELIERFGTAFLLKGGHLQGEEAVDLLFTGNEVVEFRAARVANVKTHGTGCTYSAAIAAGLAKGLGLKSAVAEAKEFMSMAILCHFHWDRGEGLDALNHGLLGGGTGVQEVSVPPILAAKGVFLLSPAEIASS